MLKILQVGKIQDFFEYMAQFIDSSGKGPIIVSPSPVKADSIRKKFDTYQQDVESITISKFIRNELNLLDDVDLLSNYKGKSELTLLLGAIWKKIGQDVSFARFQKAFNLLTEFRSFSLSDQVLETVLENYDEKLRDGVLWLHRFLNQMEIVDEHRSYFLLSERLREGNLPVEFPKDRILVFYGFDFLTASQVDLLKSLALRDDIYIPVYKEVFARSQGTDWINWFDEHNREIIDICSVKDQEYKVNAQSFPKGYLSKKLLSQNILKENLLMATKDLTRECIQEIPTSTMFSKVSIDIFSDEFEECFAHIESYLDDKTILTDVLRNKVKDQVNLMIENSQYRSLKCYLVILNKINEWEELSDENNSVGEFDLRIIKESSFLDLPRLNYATLSSEIEGKIYSLNNLDEVKDRDILVVLSSNYSGVNASQLSFTENVEKYLSSIGPLRRNQYEINILKAKFKEFLQDNNASLLVEEGLIEHDSGWSQFFNDIEFNKENDELVFKSNHFVFDIDLKEHQLQKISASKLQRYIDCPRKYYLNYVEKFSPKVELPSELGVLDLGQIEHKVIEKYFEENTSFCVNSHEKLVQENLSFYYQGKQIPEHTKDQYYVEVKSYTQGAIEKIFLLKEELGLKHKFEHDFSVVRDEFNYNGSVDCLLFNDEIKIIIDFKRSNSVFSSFKTILDFEQVQVWFYLQRLIEKKIVNINEKIAIGYIDLSNQENSMLFGNDIDLNSKLKNELGFKKINLIEDIGQSASEYLQYECETIRRMKEDHVFAAKPKSPKSCSFCAISNICSKGDEYGNS